MKNPKYDYLVVGAGFSGTVFAREMTNRGKRVLVIDKQSHVAGNCYTEEKDGIHVHTHGPHIFHTKNERCAVHVCGHVFHLFLQYNNFLRHDFVYTDDIVLFFHG